jgi:hypothetical protein
MIGNEKSDKHILDEMNALGSLIKFEKNRLSSIQHTVLEYQREYDKLQEELDRRDIQSVIYIPFEEQMKYFCDNITYSRSQYYLDKCKAFFWTMKLDRDVSGQNFIWYADRIYIKENIEKILYYLPIALENTKPSYVMETDLCYNLAIRGDSVMNMNYFPHKNLYCVEGTYLRQYNNLKDALKYMMEDGLC